MFDKFEEMKKFINKYFFDKIDIHNFEIKGALQTLREAIADELYVELPNIYDGDRQLIHSAIIIYLEAKREYDLAYLSYNHLKRVSFNKNTQELIDLKTNSDSKMLKLMKAKINLSKVCDIYAKALCVVVYDGNITLKELEELKEFGYDGSYGSSTLKLMFKLYEENIESESKLQNLRKCNEILVSNLKIAKKKVETLNDENNELMKSLEKMKEELVKQQVTLDKYQSQVNAKTYTKNKNSNGSYRIFGK